MKKKLDNTLVFTPLPVVVISTYNEDGTPDAMVASWVGEVSFHEIELNLSPHLSTDNIRQNQAFTVSFADRDHLRETDYLGIVSGRKVPDKVAKAGLHTTPSQTVHAPIIDEYPLTLECEVEKIEPIGHDVQITAKVFSTLAEERVLNEEGKVDIDLVAPLVYDPSLRVYRAVAPGILGKCWGVGKELL